jgi:membrane protease YdiL (CAAX protease family)
MAIPVLLYVSLCEGRAGIRWYMKYISIQQLLKHSVSALILFVTGAGVIVSGYILMSCRFAVWDACIGQVDENIAEYGFHDALLGLIICCAIYFPVVNPLIEEVFWRVFMLKELSKLRGYDTTESSAEQGHLLQTQPDMNLQALDITEVEKWDVSWPMRIYASVLYASYHTLVVGLFLGGVLYGALSFFCITLLGLIFVCIFLFSRQDEGFYRAVFLHAGIDTGVVIAVGDAIGWYNLV